MTAFEYTGGSLFGYKKDQDVDEYDRRTALRKNFQTAGEQSVAELGEGRGMFSHHDHLDERRFSVLIISQVSTARAMSSAVQSGSRRRTASRFPHLRSLHHKRFFPLIASLFPGALCKLSPFIMLRL